MKKSLVLLTILIASTCFLVGCEDKEPQQKAQAFTYTDREGKPLPAKEQMVDAVRNGDLPHLKALHQQGADLSAKHDDLPALIEVAIENRRGVVLQYLLDNGVDPNAPWGSKPFFRDPLTEAVERGWSEGVRLLVAKGANVNRYVDDEEDRYAMPLYFRALKAGYLGIAQFLVDKGADPTYRRADGYTALFVVIDDNPAGAMVSPNPSAMKENLPAVRLAVENGADINAVYRDMTPLIMAAKYGKKEIYDYLVSQGANPEKKDTHGNTPAEYYARSNHAERDGTPKARADTPLNYRVLVRYSGHPIKLYINGTLVKDSTIGWSAILSVSCKDYIKKGENTVRVTWGAMPGEPGWDASTARYNDPSYVRIRLEAQYDKDGKELETIFWKNISLADAITLEDTKVPAYEFSFNSD